MHRSSTGVGLFCALAALVTLAAVGCGREPLMRDEFCERWARSACTPEVLSVCQKSASACQAAQASSCRDWLPNDFQDAGVDDCLEAVSNAYADADLNAEELDVVWRLSGPCSDVVVAGEGGERCDGDEDCSRSAGLACVFKDGMNGTCERAVRVEAGFSCTEPHEQCEAGFYCNGENCIAARDVEESCTNDTQCKVGLYCSEDACVERAPIGTDCSSDQQCESGICYEVDVDEQVCVDRIRLSPAEPACDSLR